MAYYTGDLLNPFAIGTPFEAEVTRKLPPAPVIRTIPPAAAAAVASLPGPIVEAGAKLTPKTGGITGGRITRRGRDIFSYKPGDIKTWPTTKATTTKAITTKATPSSVSALSLGSPFGALVPFLEKKKLPRQRWQPLREDFQQSSAAA